MGGIMNKGTPIIDINLNWCKGCGLCVEFCPRKVLALDIGKVYVQREDECIVCNMCQRICPDYAINVRRDEYGKCHTDARK